MRNVKNAHPVTFYLDQLASSSRRTMRRGLVSFVSWHQGHGCSIFQYPWHTVTKQTLLKYRQALVDEGVAASTINTHLSAVRGVLRQSTYNAHTPSQARMTVEVLATINDVKTIPISSNRKTKVDEATLDTALNHLDDSAQGMRDEALIRFIWATSLSAQKIARVGYAADQSNVRRIAHRFDYIFVPQLNGLLYADPHAGYNCSKTMPLIPLSEKTHKALVQWSQRHLKSEYGALFVRVRSNTNIDVRAPLSAASVFYILDRVKRLSNQPLIAMRYLSKRNSQQHT